MKQVTTFSKVLEELGIPELFDLDKKEIPSSKRLRDIEARLKRLEASMEEINGSLDEPRVLGE